MHMLRKVVFFALLSFRKSSMSVKKEEEKKPHVKKPLNAFMLYMKEMRAKVVAECTLKESAAINQILGRRVGACFLQLVKFKYLSWWASQGLTVHFSTVALFIAGRTGQVL